MKMMRLSRCLIQLAACGGIALTCGPAFSAEAPRAKTTTPQAKEFVLVRHYNYQERRYEPPVALSLTPPAAPAAEATEPRFASAEQALTAQLSALQAGDFAAWLNTWDEAARRQIQTRGAAFAQPSGAWRQPWQEKFQPGASVTLTRWILTGTYVILTYRIGRGDETAVAFHLTGERWKATLELEDDPVLLHFKDGKTKIEKTIR